MIAIKWKAARWFWIFPESWLYCTSVFITQHRKHFSNPDFKEWSLVFLTIKKIHLWDVKGANTIVFAGAAEIVTSKGRRATRWRYMEMLLCFVYTRMSGPQKIFFRKLFNDWLWQNMWAGVAGSWCKCKHVELILGYVSASLSFE